MKTISELQELIIDWAKEKNLNDPDKQYLKILEEVGETARAILKNDVPEIKDGIGDIAVTVIIYYWQNHAEIEFEYYPSGQDAKDAFSDTLWSVQELDSDVFNWLEDLAISQDTDLQECLNLAWNEIKDRQGKTINGTFIKN